MAKRVRLDSACHILPFPISFNYHLDMHKSAWSWILWLGCSVLAAGCGHSGAGTIHDRHTAALFNNAAAPEGSIRWEVVDRFRLVNQPGGTRELFRRYESYYETVYAQINDQGMLPTWWDAIAARYRDGYVKFDRWKVRLTAPFKGKCEWTIAGAVKTDTCEGHEVEVGKDGTQVSVRPVDGASLVEATVQPRDVLIASLGDSYAAGEGVPDLRGNWKVFPVWKESPVWMDERCHRSLFSAPGLATLMYAAVNPHVSVTHLTFACSGAEVKTGILQPYVGAAPGKHRFPLPSQIDALQAALEGTGRTPDILTFSGGGNDIGFADVVLAATLSDETKLALTIQRHVPVGEKSVRSALPLVQCALDNAGISPSRTTVLMTEYPNPTNLLKEKLAQTDSDVLNACGGKGNGTISFPPGLLTWMANVKKEELELITNRVASPLQNLLRTMSTQLGATLITGIDEDFRQHGFCAPGLNLATGHVRWVNTVRDSSNVVGGLSGSMHPNIRGQDSIARHLLEGIIRAECDSKRIAETDPVHASLCTGTAWKDRLPGYLKTQGATSPPSAMNP